MSKKEYWLRDFYTIEEYSLGKCVHVFGYFDNEHEDSEKPARCTEFTGVIIDLNQFLKLDSYEYDILIGNCTWYIEAMTTEEAIDCMNHYFNGSPPTELAYNDLTLDTPCGMYVDDGRRFG